MNLFTQLLRRTVAVLAIVFTVGAASVATAAEEAELGSHVGTIGVPEGLSKAEIKEAIVLTFAGRQWSIKERDDERVVGYLKHRSNEATVTVVYSAEKVDFYCVGYAINKNTGERRRPEIPEGWLKFLKGDLNKKLTAASALK